MSSSSLSAGAPSPEGAAEPPDDAAADADDGLASSSRISHEEMVGPYFPTFHPRPSVGHVNDISGPFEYNGVYHLFVDHACGGGPAAKRVDAACLEMGWRLATAAERWAGGVPRHRLGPFDVN